MHLSLNNIWCWMTDASIWPLSHTRVSFISIKCMTYIKCWNLWGRSSSFFFLSLHSTVPAVERRLSNNALVWWRFSVIKDVVIPGLVLHPWQLESFQFLEDVSPLIQEVSSVQTNPPTMQCWVPSPESVTTIHTWAHLAYNSHSAS